MTRRIGWLLVASALSLLLGSASAQTKTPASPKATTDAAIKQAIIAQSIANYSGSCPCPYSQDRAGRRCGGRSAYSRPGGASPVCFETDVTPKIIADYRKAKRR